jgi:hypothetical protein
MKQTPALNDCLKLEKDMVDEILTFFSGKHDFDKIIYTEWTAKDVLAHITMWHESFANTILCIINDEEPKLLKGLLHEINENGVREYKKYSIKELREKLKTAQEKINENIGNNKIKLIPYRKDSKRIYTREAHLEITYKHLKGHYEHIQTKYN